MHRYWWSRAPISAGRVAFQPRHVLLALCVLLQALLIAPGGGLAQDAAATLRQLQAIDKAGPPTSELGNAYHNLAIQLRSAGQNGRAEQPARRALAIWEQVHGVNSGAVANACNTLAMILDQLAKSAEAEQCARRAVRLWENEHGRDSGEAANALHTLVSVMRTRGQWEATEEPMRRILRIWTRTNGPDSDAVANASNTLSGVLQTIGKLDEAEKLARNALRIWEKLNGPDSAAADNARNTLAGPLEGLGRRDEAIAVRRRVLASASNRSGADSEAAGNAANNLAWTLLGADQVEEAEQLFQQTLKISTAMDTRAAKPSTVVPLQGLARTAMRKRDWQQAHARVEQAVKISIARTRIASAAADKTQASQAPSEIAQAGGNLQLLIMAADQLAAAEPPRRAALARETFGYAQWRLGSRAADALAAMAGRVAVDPSLATAVRQRQDLEARWQVIDRTLLAEGNKGADKRNRKAEQALVEEANSIEAKLRQLGARLSGDFAKYTAIARIEPLTVEETQKLLNPDEALVLFLPAGSEPPLPEETFVWVVTRTDARWVRSDLGAAALQREVAALRCGLDIEAWLTKTSSCPEHVKAGYTKADAETDKPPPFDLGRAHALYKALFGDIEDLIKDKRQLLLVPSGALSQLPFQVLVRKAPEPARAGDQAHRNASWLIRTHALAVLPSVASLQVLRRHARPSNASRPMIGFGNPLLKGYQARAGDTAEEAKTAELHAEWAALAEQKQSCPGELGQQRLAAASGTKPRRRSATLGASADPKSLLAQVPLPETADELCAVAGALKADLRDIHLGERATEAEVKRLSATGALARYRVVHFATHGIMAGELTGALEPGLILTPPKKRSQHDEGYLSASEIASLKLDADWVILSACNTAASGAASAEALSGLARAFIYAQARTLLVSHWAVASEATQSLVTGAVKAMAGDTKLGRAEAMRLAMLALIESKEGHEAHPAFWAPFVLLGEGAAGK